MNSKKTPIQTLAIALTLTLAGSVAFAGNRAQAPQKQQTTQKAHQKAQKLLQKFDRNGDGVLDAAELEAVVIFKHKKRHKMKKRFDTDGDGQLSPAERQAMRAAKQQRKAQILQNFDRNGNGQLEPAERQAARQSMVTTRVTRRFDRMLSRHDANQDGALSWSEIDQVIQSKAARKPGHKVAKKAAKMRQIFQAADRNGDGLVTRNEFTHSARARIQQRQQKRQGHPRAH